MAIAINDNTMVYDLLKLVGWQHWPIDPKKVLSIEVKAEANGDLHAVVVLKKFLHKRFFYLEKSYPDFPDWQNDLLKVLKSYGLAGVDLIRRAKIKYGADRLAEIEVTIAANTAEPRGVLKRIIEDCYGGDYNTFYGDALTVSFAHALAKSIIEKMDFDELFEPNQEKE